MGTMEYKFILKELTKKTSISGFEEEFSNFLCDKISNLCDNVEIDYFNNVIGSINNDSQKENKYENSIMLAAHMDEIGLMVKSVDDRGFIRFTNIGGIDPKILFAQEVKVHGKKDIIGIIGAKPPHLINNSDRLKGISIKDLYIDTGYTKEELEELVSLGDVISFNTELISLKGSYISSKSLDNRVGICTLMGVMNELKKYKYDKNTIFNFTSTEETLGAGIINSTYSINPKLAIIIDTCHGKVQGSSKEDTFTLGGGPVISIGANFNSKYTKKIINIAKEEKISYQIDVEPGNSGTDAWFTQVSRKGIPTILISIPIKYMHTPIEVMKIDDIKLSVNLITNFLVRLQSELNFR
jgi:endoglucanase